jgi:hypothetical protein
LGVAIIGVDGRGMSQEAPASLCEGLVGKLLWFTLLSKRGFNFGCETWSQPQVGWNKSFIRTCGKGVKKEKQGSESCVNLDSGIKLLVDNMHLPKDSPVY